MIYKVPTEEQINKISDAINDIMADVDKTNMSVIFKLDSNTVKKIDETYFFKHHKKEEYDNFKPSDNVIINSGGISFEFKSI
jgi:histidinol phosphatase-like enzyme